jgi:hypothetical protein
MRPSIRLPDLSPEATAGLDELYRTTRDVRLSTRAHIILLAAEQHLTAPEIAKIMRCDEPTVRSWLKRYLAEGIQGLAICPGLVHRARPPLSTARRCCEPCGSVRAAWSNPTRCGPCSLWPTIWPSEPASAWKRCPSASIC